MVVGVMIKILRRAYIWGYLVEKATPFATDGQGDFLDVVGIGIYGWRS
jgi:hypothetical protein